VHKPLDHIATVLALAASRSPAFWLGILLILFFGVHLKWLPISGSGTWQISSCQASPLLLSDCTQHALTRSSMLDFMQRDFVRTARARYSESQVVMPRATQFMLRS